MAYESSVIVGSGLNPRKREQFLPKNSTSQERHLRGTSVVLINPEDNSAGGSGLTGQITVGTTATKIPTVPLQYRRAVAIFNASSTETLYIGFNASVTTGTGFPIPPSSSLPMDINAEVEVWGIASASVDIRILQLS